MPQTKAIQQSFVSNNIYPLTNTPKPGFNGGAIIDDQGKETAITEEMIQKACDELSNAWLFPRQAQRH